jgi:hypothetical protein
MAGSRFKFRLQGFIGCGETARVHYIDFIGLYSAGAQGKADRSKSDQPGHDWFDMHARYIRCSD